MIAATGKRTLLAALLGLSVGVGPARAGQWPTRHPGPWQRIHDAPAQKQLRAALKDKGKICFATNRDGNFEIYVTNPDGSGQVNLTKNPAWDLHPRWSSDGKRIVFHSDRDSTKKLRSYLKPNLSYPLDNWDSRNTMHAVQDGLSTYVMDADGGNLKRLVEGGLNATFSPDGKFIVFERHDRIIVMELATGKQHAGTPWVWGAAWRPSFSPDGKMLLSAVASQWTAYHPIAYGPCLFYLDEQLRPSGKYWKLAGGGIGTQPEWSPDGTRILFTRDTRGAVMGYVDLTEKRKNRDTWLTFHPIDIGLDKDKHILACPNWSPDGKHVVFSLSPVYFDVKPRVKKLGYTPWDQEGQIIYQELCIARLDGTAWIQLTDGGYANRDPDWRP